MILIKKGFDLVCRILLLSLLAILFSGCINKEPEKITYKQTALYGNAIQYTQSVQIKNQKEVKAIFTVTYLDPIHDVFNEKGFDQFIVGIYIVEPYENIYDITVNSKAPLKIEDLTPAHPMYGRLPSYNKWASYKLVTAISDDKLDKVTVSLEHLNLGVAKATFQAR